MQGQGGILRGQIQRGLELPAFGSYALYEGLVFDLGPDPACDVELAAGGEYAFR
jgi:hypothetical protein